MDLLYFVVFVSVLIFIHEAGHFAFAKIFGVKVLTFSVGFGPKLVKIRGRDVAYIWGINNISVGIFGIPAAFLAQIIVTWFTRPAPQAMQDFIDSIRVPAGNVRLVSAEHAVKE